jgi:diadenosine tetraphosphate (Ap4A) HIT family hydrolase
MADDRTCHVCIRNQDRGDSSGLVVWEDATWLLRHFPKPAGVAGWLTLYSKRHTAGFATFDEEEAASVGPVLGLVQRELIEASGALRTYTVAMGESAPHFHCHIVPRYPETPGGRKAWDLFSLRSESISGEPPVADGQVDDVVTRLRSRLAPSGAGVPRETPS